MDTPDSDKLSNADEIKTEVEKTVQELADQVPDKKDPDQAEGKKPTFTFDQLRSAYYQNEYGDADITVPLFKNRFLRDNATGEFYIFRDHRWHMCLNREHEAAFREVADVYGLEAAACKKRAKKATDENDTAASSREKRWQDQFNERARKLRGKARMSNVLTLATAGDNSLGTSGENWNLSSSLFPVANGVVDMETGKLRPGRYDDWFFHGSPIEYKNLNYGGEYVQQLLKQLLCGDEELINYMELVIGFGCTGIQTKDFFVAYGPLGDNGKSVLFDWISYVMGGFAGSIPVELIYEDRFGRDPDKPSPQLLNLRGLRMAIMSEPAANKRLSISKIKFLTSGTDKIGARNLNEKKIIYFWPTHTLIMHGNEIPQVYGHQNAFYNRLRLIPFRARFVKDDAEVDEANHIYKMVPRAQVDKMLREHDCEMLSFLMRCAKKALALGDMPAPPKSVTKETQDFRNDADIVGRWLSLCTDKVDFYEVGATTAYVSFKKFCEEYLGLTEKQIPSQKFFGSDLRNRPHIERKEGHTITYKGIQIKSEWLSIV